ARYYTLRRAVSSWEASLRERYRTPCCGRKETLARNGVGVWRRTQVCGLGVDQLLRHPPPPGLPCCGVLFARWTGASKESVSGPELPLLEISKFPVAAPLKTS
ncbi:unnamed protein product, partial [Scytosiphon promiscuus]